MQSTRSVSRSIEIGLRLTGIWPGSKYEIVFRCFWIIVMAAGQVCQYWYALIHFNRDDLSELVDGMSTALPYSLLFVKLIIFWINQGVFIDILARMSKDWAESSDQATKIMMKKAELSYRCTTVIFVVYVLAVVIYTSVTIQIDRQIRLDGLDIPRQLLIKMQLPFPYSKSPTYEYVILLQFIQLLFVSSTISLFDALMVALILHIDGQINIMQDVLMEIPSGKKEYGLSKDIIVFLIKKHYKIIDLSRNVEKLFTHMALLQFFCNTLIICGIGFTIVFSVNTGQSITIVLKSIFFGIAITLEAFIYCFSGEYLSNKSISISDAAYESFWYVLKPEDSRVMLLLMRRSQKRLTITAGNFTDLSLEAFTAMLKTSASYISVLNAMY